jgi:cytochrome c
MGGESSDAWRSVLDASASADRGAQVAKQCQACHNFEEGQGPKVGPHLYGVVG